MLKFLKRTIATVCGSLLLSLPLASHAQQDDEELAFGQCRGCHQVGPDARHQFGPVLNGVMDRAAGRAERYEYSDAFTSKAADPGLFWDDTTMDEFLQAPMQYITGTKMAFPGITEESKRQLLIAYLKRFDAEGNDLTLVEEVVEAPVVETVRKLASDFEVPEEGMGRWPILAGGHDTLTDDRPEKTIGSYWPYLSTVYDYIRRAMPFGNSRSLTDDEIYSITAYLLFLNDVVEDEEFELGYDNFNTIKLPNEDNFIADTRGQEPLQQLSESDICMSNCYPEPAVVTQRARVLDVTPE